MSYTAKDLASQYRQTGLRRAQLSWAGGKTFFEVRYIGGKTPKCSTETVRVWSANGKWSGNNLYVELELPSNRWVTQMVAGVLTIARRVDFSARTYRAFWLSQGQGFSVKIVSGYVVRGYHIPVDDRELAEKWLPANARTRQMRFAKSGRSSRMRQKNGLPSTTAYWRATAMSVQTRLSRVCNHCYMPEGQSARYAGMSSCNCRTTYTPGGLSRSRRIDNLSLLRRRDPISTKQRREKNVDNIHHHHAGYCRSHGVTLNKRRNLTMQDKYLKIVLWARNRYGDDHIHCLTWWSNTKFTKIEALAWNRYIIQGGVK